MYKDISEIRKAYDDGEYTYYTPQSEKIRKVPEGYIFDEDKSVKWNREQVLSNNERAMEQIKEERRKQNELMGRLHQDVVQYLMGVYDFSAAVAEKIEELVYADKHHGMHEYFDTIDSCGDFVSDILRLAKEGK